MSGYCPICQSASNIKYEDNDKSITNVDCKSCGKFELTNSALIMFQRSVVKDKVLSLSFTIRQNQTSKQSFKIDTVMMRKLLSTPFNSLKPFEQANKLLLWIGNNVGKPNGETNIELKNLLSVIGSSDEDGLKYVAYYLKDQGYIKNINFSYSTQDGAGYPPEDLLTAQMTFKGWAKFEELERTNKDSKLVFMAMKYGDDELELIYKRNIKKALDSTGFEIRKLEDEKRAGLIDDKLRVEIRRSKFLIADLTHDNNGAYWEAGYAEGLGMPVIYICKKEKFKKKKTHFDTNHHLTVIWDKENLTEFEEELKATIRATFPTEAKMED